jgi:GGDEF domain-containing protein
MYLDLHGLKTGNDSYGHQAGDVALIKGTARLSGVLGSNGLVYRLGEMNLPLFCLDIKGNKK